MSDERVTAPTSRRYTQAQKDQAIRLVRHIREDTGERYGAVQRVARQLGYGVETVRKWVNQADIEAGHLDEDRRAERGDGGRCQDGRAVRDIHRARRDEQPRSSRAMRHVSALHSARSWIAPIWAPVPCTATSEPTARSGHSVRPCRPTTPLASSPERPGLAASERADEAGGHPPVP